MFVILPSEIHEILPTFYLIINIFILLFYDIYLIYLYEIPKPFGCWLHSSWDFGNYLIGTRMCWARLLFWDSNHIYIYFLLKNSISIFVHLFIWLSFNWFWKYLTRMLKHLIMNWIPSLLPWIIFIRLYKCWTCKWKKQYSPEKDIRRNGS